jgi:hypothetical protein
MHKINALQLGGDGQCQADDLSLEFFEPPVSQFSIVRF